MLNTQLLFLLFLLSVAVKSERVNAANSISKMATLGVEHFETGIFAEKKSSFFEKMALKAAERKLRKTWQRAAETQGDSIRPCGKIVLQNGDTLAVDLSELNRTQVKYRRCGHRDDPIFILARADVQSVLASNGDVLHNNQKLMRVSKNSKAKAKPLKKDSSLATISFIFSLLAFLLSLGIGPAGFPLALVGLVCGSIAYFRTKSDPERYSGKGFAVASLVIGALGMVLILL